MTTTLGLIFVAALNWNTLQPVPPLQAPPSGHADSRTCDLYREYLEIHERTKGGFINQKPDDIRRYQELIKFGAEAVKKLKDLMRHSENDQVQLAASRELLDRGFGRPGQEIGLKTSGVIVHVNRQRYQPLPIAVQVATVTVDAESSDPMQTA